MTESAKCLMKIPFPAFVLYCTALLLFPYDSAGAVQPAANAGKTSVKNSSVQVHSGPSAQSKVVKSLDRGASVTVEIEMKTSDGDWCGVAEQGMSSLSGYVPCDSLEQRNPSPVTWKFIGSKEAANQPGPPAGRSVSTPDKPKRPYSDITALLYMTTW